MYNREVLLDQSYCHLQRALGMLGEQSVVFTFYISRQTGEVQVR